MKLIYLSLSTLLLSTAASAAPSIAVLPFEGDRTSEVTAAALSVLQDNQVTVVTAPQWRAAKAKLGKRLPRAKSDAKAGEALGVQYVLRGRIKRVKRYWGLTVQLRRARDGRLIKRWRIRDRRKSKVEKLIASSLWPTLSSAIAEAEAQAGKRIAMVSFVGSTKTEVKLTKSIKKGLDAEVIATHVVKRWADEKNLDLSNKEHRLDLSFDKQIAAYVYLEATRKGKRYRMQATLLDGASNRVLTMVTTKYTSRSRAIRKIIRSLQKPLAEAQVAKERIAKPVSVPAVDGLSEPNTPPQASEPNPKTQAVAQPMAQAAEATPVAASPSAGQASTEVSRSQKWTAYNQSAVQVLAGVGFLQRDLNYRDDITGLNSYSAPGAVTVQGEVVWYPGAMFVRRGIARHIGVDLGFERTIGLASQQADGTRFDSMSQQVDPALRLRIPVGAHEIRARLGGGLHQFTISDAVDGTDSGVPSVNYGYLRAGAGFRLVFFDRVNLAADAGWRQVISAGEIANDEWFPRQSVGAIDAKVALGYGLSRYFDLTVSMDLRRYFFSMNPEPGDRAVAGGAVDQTIAGSLALAFRL